jgi:YVTN family beta-propeller protein
VTGSYPIRFSAASNGQTVTLDATLVIANTSSYLVSLGSAAVRAGSSTTKQVNTGYSGTPGIPPSYKLLLSIGALPSGVSASFSPATVTPGQSSTLTLTASGNAVTTRNFSVLVTGTPTVNLPASSTPLVLNVVPAQLPTNRSEYVATEGNIVSAAYDAAHQQVFASNPSWNRVDVISAVTQKIVGSVNIPSPRNVELTPDKRRVIVGTDTSKVYWIDTATLRVSQSATFPQSTSNYLRFQFPRSPHQLSTGKILLMWKDESGISSAVIWDMGSGVTHRPSYPPASSVEFIAMSSDGTKALIAGASSGDSSAVYDAASDSITAVRQGAVDAVAADPTGSKFLITGFDGVGLYDSSLNLLATLLPGGTRVAGLLFSPDGKSAYVVTDTVTYTFDVVTKNMVGVAPALAVVTTLSVTQVESPMAVDDTGLIFGASNRGLAIDDTTYYNNVTIGSNTGGLSPGVGPVGAATPFSLFGGPALPDIYFGGQLATNMTDHEGEYKGTTPRIDTPGPVNVKVYWPNGTQGYLPMAYTYGPYIQTLRRSMATPGGGASAEMVGFGFPSDSSAIQITVGGLHAPVVTSNSRKVTFTVPPGIPGKADVAITTADGSHILAGAFTYLAEATDYTSGTDQFSALLYDAGRSSIYLTAGDHIDVFSLSTRTFSSPINVPSLNGKWSLGGMALTPDGKRLLVTNQTDGSLTIIDAANTASSVAIPVAAPTMNGSCVIGPIYVAATNDGSAFVTTGEAGTALCRLDNAAPETYKVNLGTGTLSKMFDCANTFVEASRDGSQVVFGRAGYGAVCGYEVASGTFGTATVRQTSGIAFSGDGNTVASSRGLGSWYILDRGLGVTNIPQLPDVYLPSDMPWPHMALNDAGSLLFHRYKDAVDVVDVKHGALVARIGLSQQIPDVLVPMAIDSEGRKVFLITDQGLTVLQLAQVPLSVGSVTPANGSSGTSVKVRGSSFTAGTTVTLNGVAAPTVQTDSETLQITVPGLPAAGSVRMIVTNPDGRTYTLEDAFSYQ